MTAYVKFACDDCAAVEEVVIADNPQAAVISYMPDGWYESRYLPPNEEKRYHTCPKCFDYNRRLARGEKLPSRRMWALARHAT